VAADAGNGKVTTEGARRDYGVVIDPETNEVDEPATAELRDRRRANGE
jgi:hypothetical protein